MSNNELSVKDFLNNHFGFNNDFSIENAKNIAIDNLDSSNITIPSVINTSNILQPSLPESHLPKGVYKFDGEKLVRVGDV